MKKYDPTVKPRTNARPCDTLRVALTFPRPDGPGPVKFGARISPASALRLEPDPRDVDRAIDGLRVRGFQTTTKGHLTVSMRCTRAQYETVFGTQLTTFDSPNPGAAQFARFLFPAAGAPWQPDPAVAALIDDAYIQWPHIYMGEPTHASPDLGYHYLSVPEGITRLLNVDTIHQRGLTGTGIRVAMVDSGFDQSHPWFASYRAQSSVVLAPGASDRHSDSNGHGTGESANLLSVAPGVTFIGVKVDNDSEPGLGASMLEGFQEALRHNPHVISVSMGYDLRGAGNVPLATLPHSLVALEVEIQAAVARGTVVVFSAGNGHYGFPGQMPDLISAGGVYVDENGNRQASNYASAFPSAIYAGRSVPDFCGLVGMLPDANYIRLPIPEGCEIDRDMSPSDNTPPSDGWGVFSGTSAAAPQIAGLCALLLQRDPALKPVEIKALLERTSHDVTTGRANPASDPNGAGGIAASLGSDGATGAGLVDALAAIDQV